MISAKRLRWGSLVGSFFALTALAFNVRLVLVSFNGSEEVVVPTSNVTILIWHWPFDRALDLTGDVCSRLYNIHRCELTDDRGKYGRADVVVFHHMELGRRGSELPPKPRPPGQKWVWANLESPSNVRGVGKWNHIFNWTLTYREDSDIFMPYGKLLPRASMSPINTNKTGLVAWVVSHYQKTQERVPFVTELSNYLKVDVYGQANQNPLCPSCLVPTVSRYFFYLSLENSVHEDYITEKLWKNAFLAGAVPVVLGPPRKNYEKFAPPDSFIHVSDFPSPRHLADFMLSVTPRRYLQYLRWRKEFEVKLFTDWRERFCTICSKYSSLPQNKTYADLGGWFHNGD
ncbi:alpha-(1,3)-fucosyltransferase 7 [Spea bombifrons]|uniref:alpha-(1,3)-fucosyltransferase 7 n=1 Tax=Spea bombifrons TaxID=233779 RepID=UPI0023495279|nr:alpha-(1,3)-fucosyltransferase 7 [Spea bombifrons]